MLLAVVATLADGYAVMFVLPDAPETARETVVDIQADPPGVEWLQRTRLRELTRQAHLTTDQQPVTKVQLHSTDAASRLAAREA
jgi:hypothetical protein